MKKLLFILLLCLLLPNMAGAKLSEEEKEYIRKANTPHPASELLYTLISSRRGIAANVMGHSMSSALSPDVILANPKLWVENLITDEEFKKLGFTEEQKKQFIEEEKAYLARMVEENKKQQTEYMENQKEAETAETKRAVWDIIKTVLLPLGAMIGSLVFTYKQQKINPRNIPQKQIFSCCIAATIFLLAAPIVYNGYRFDIDVGNIETNKLMFQTGLLLMTNFSLFYYLKIKPFAEKKEFAQNTDSGAVQTPKSQGVMEDAISSADEKDPAQTSDSGAPHPPTSRGFMENAVYCLKNALNFSGRAGRKEFWQFTLFFILFLFLLDKVRLRGDLEDIIALAVLLVFWAVSVRRLHDAGKSGWWVLIWGFPALQSFWGSFFAALPESWVTFAGGIWSILFFYFLYLLCKQGDQGDNKYGPDPLR